MERKYAVDVWEIINSDSVRSQTLFTELLAKAANASFGSSDDFRHKLEKEGLLKVSQRKFDTGRFDNKTIEETCVLLFRELDDDDEVVSIKVDTDGISLDQDIVPQRQYRQYN